MLSPGASREAKSVERFFQFSLLGLVISGFFALAGSGYLDRPTIVLTLLGLAMRAAVVSGALRVQIPVRAISLIGVAYVAFFPIDFYFISRDFLTTTIHGVCFLAVVRILTAQSNRDYIYSGAISFLELIAAALLSAQSVLFFYLALYIVFAIAAFTSAEIRRGLQRAALGNAQTAPVTRARIAWRLAAVACGATFGILVLTAGLFLIVPRTATMAARFLPRGPRLTGFSSVVDLGGFGAISRDNRVVMHILSGSRPLPPDLKWRGAALSRFDGKRWFEPPSRAENVAAAPHAAVVAGRLQLSRRDGRRMLYRVDLENADTGTLFIAGIPEFISIDAPRLLVTQEETFRVLAPPRETLRYQVSAHPGPPLAQFLSRADRERYLQFPPLDARIISLARQWAGAGTDLESALRIQQHLRREFGYKLEGPEEPVPDPLANFLFVRKEGYCEYFASAMAVMLRSVGVPSRVATGFLSGYFNDVSGLTVVRASDAHAWVEAYIDGRGWLTFDPTPAGTSRTAGGFMSRLNMYLDAADHTWHEWVVAYDPGHQVLMAARFEAALRGLIHPVNRAGGSWTAAMNSILRRSGKWLAAIIAAGFFAFYFGPDFWRQSRSRSRVRQILRRGGAPSDARVLYEAMLERLAGRGFHKPAHCTPAEFTQQLPRAEADRVRRFTDLYNSARFGGNMSAMAGMAGLLQEFDAR